MKKTLKLFAVAVLGLFVSVAMNAQLTTSTMSGKITDKQGAVPGAAIIATHVPTGAQYYAVSNNEGRYSIQGMRPGGPYTVSVQLLGYKTTVFTDVTLKLSEIYAQDVQLQDATEQLDEVVVVASASKFVNEKTGASTNVSNRQMMDLPNSDRSISAITKLSPYSNGMSFAGADGRSTNFTVDGANLNNNFGLSSSLPGGGSPISIDAIEEMQVVISPFDVRQSNFIGGGVNAITKSGTNTTKGSAYVYHRNENMHGNRVDDTELSERAIDRQTTYGMTLGGPIIKNKLFYFINAEKSTIPTVVNRWKPSEDGVADPDRNITRVSMNEAKTMSDFLKKEYGYDPGSYTDYPADESNLKLLARIDWNINNKNHLALRYNYTHNVSWNMPSTSRDAADMAYGTLSQYGLVFSNAMYKMNNDLTTFSFDLNSNISDNLSNQLLVTYSDVEDVRGSNSDEFPFVDILAGDLGESNMPYMTFGYELFTWKNRVGNKTITAKDDLTYYAGNHKLMGGVSYEFQEALNCYMRNGTGMYRYASLSDFYAKKAPVEMAFDWGYDGEEEPSATVRFSQVGAYFQDEWTPSNNFKLTAGVRFDTIIFNNDDIMTNNAILALDYGGRNVNTGLWPETNVQISPRIGFNWDVFGNKVLKVRGGTGLFAGRLPLVFFTNMPTNAGLVKGRATKVTDKNLLAKFAGGMVTDKSEILRILNSYDSKSYPTTITPDDGVVTSEFCGVDRNFKMPQVWKSTIAFDLNIPVSFPLTLSGEYIYNKTINGVMLSNWNIYQDNSGWTQFTGADNRHMYPSTYKYNKKGDAMVLTNTNKGYGWIADVQLKAEPVKNLEVIASYTHTVSKELTGMPGSNASAAWKYIPTVEGPNFMYLHNSSFNNPDRLMASVSYRDNANNSFSLFYEGWRYGGNTYQYVNDMNGDGFAYDVIYIPKDNSEIKFVSTDDANRFWEYVEQDKYLSSHKGQYSDAYGVITPFHHSFDFRYAHDFAINVGNVKNTLQLSFDIMNVGNLFNSKWGVAKSFSDEALGGKILKYEGVDTDGAPLFSTRVESGAKTWDLSHSYGNCWYMQIGIKYLFN